MSYRRRRHSSEESVAESNTDTETDKSMEDVPGPFQFVDDTLHSSHLLGFGELYESGQLFDMTLCVDGEEFNCHKVLLAASSAYFRTMFTINLAEKDKTEITINGVDATSMHIIIKYLYTRKAHLETDSVQNLLSAANLFQLHELRDGCATYMAKKLDNDNCIGIHFFAQAHDCDHLLLASKDMIMEHFNDVSESIEFLQMTPENLKEILKLDEIQAIEEDIYESVCLWLDHQPEDRSPHIFEIFSLIRFMLMDEYFLFDNVKSNPYLQAEPRISALLDEVIKFKLLKNRWDESDLMLEPRAGHNFARVVVYNTYIDDEKRQVMQVYGPRAEDVCRAANLGLCDLPAENPAILVTGDGDLYIAGGDDGANILLKWSPDDNVFEDCASMPVSRKQFCLVQVDKLIYAVGGNNHEGNLSRVDCYNEEEDEWKSVAPLPKPLRCFCAVSYGGKLYVFGGETEKISKKVTRGRAELNRQTMCYSPQDNKWTVLADMSHSRALCGCAVFQNRIYVIGGFGTITESWVKDKSPESCLASVEIFDPRSNSWSVGPELPAACCGMGVVKYKQTLYVLGGEDDKDMSNAVYYLTPGGDAWIHDEEMMNGMTETTINSSYAVITMNLD